MNRVHLVRHGESIWNQGSKFTGWTNIPLTDRGRREGETIARALQKHNIVPTVFFSSVLTRAVDTAHIIRDTLESSAPVFTSWRLNEKHYGALEGVRREHIRTTYGDLFTRTLRSNFFMKPPILPQDQRNATETYPIFRNCYLNSIQNGESKQDVLLRSLPYFENDILYTLLEGHTPLVVTHKHCIRVIMKHYLELQNDAFEKYALPEHSVLSLEFDPLMRFVDFSTTPY